MKNPIPFHLFASLAIFFTLAISAESTTAQDFEKINIKKPITIHGNVNVQFDYYHATGIPVRQKEFSWMITGSPLINVLGVDVPLSFLVSNYDNKFYQPFNQFGISPKYKWATVHLGYRNITFSKYTLAGHRILGGGFDLTPKKYRIGFMYGLLRRSTSIDTTMNANPLYIRPAPVYKRMALAGKVGYGTDKNFIDLIYFKGWDKTSSLDSKLKDSILPAENTTIGINTKVTLTKKLTWSADVGLSAYTQNRNDEKDTTGVKKDWPKSILGLLVKDKISSNYYFAGETRVGYTEKKWGAQLVYKRIDPSYQSMGAYFFQNDIQEISLANNFKLDSGRLNINTSIGFQKDNLKKQKTSTSKRFIGNANISYTPSQKFGINFNYSNFGISNNPLPTSMSNELFKQVSNSFMLMPYFNWLNQRSIKNLNIIASYQSLNTPKSNLGSVPDLNTYSITTLFNYTWIKEGINANAAVNYINSKTSAGDIGSYGGTIGGMIPLLQRKATFNASGSYLQNTFNNSSSGYTIRATAGFGVPIGTHHNFQLVGNYMTNSSTSAITPSFDELTVQFIYGLTF